MVGVRAERQHLCLPLADWPAVDRACWAAALCPGDLLIDFGPGAHLKPGTHRACAASYGRWLGWLASEGELDPGAAPGERVTRCRVMAFIAALNQINAPLTVLGRIDQMVKVLRWFEPQRDWSWLGAIIARLRARADPVKNKRLRLRSAHELLALGRRLMLTAETVAGPSSRRRARLYRDGLMIAFLAARPLRLANLVQLELNRELVQRSTGWWIEIQGADTKTGELIELPFPEDLVSALELYLRIWRPMLARPERSSKSRALWLSNRGTAISDIQAYNKIVAHTRAAFGRAVNPHLFRDAAATTVAIERPEQVRLTARLLGHRSFATTERYYNLARATEAASALHQVLEAISNSD